MCQKVGCTVLKQNNFNTCYIIFLLCLPYSIFFCHGTSTKKKEKQKPKMQMRSSMLEQAHKSGLVSTYLKALSHVPGKSVRQHYSNKVWPAFL